MIEGNYYAASNEEGPYSLGPYETKEACIADAKTEYADELAEGSNIWIGKGKAVQINLDADTIIEQAGEQAYDELYEDALDDWCKDIPRDKINDLSKRLTEVFHKWLEENDQQYEFVCIDPVEYL